MGGAADGQTVLRTLKSVFPRNVEGKGTHFIFRIFTSFTPVILLILAGLIFWQRMCKEHINCFAPPDEDIRTEAVNQYCFVTGTYTITGYPEKMKNLRKSLPYPGVGPRIPPSAENGGGTQVKYHLYFQWVPFVLAIQAVLFYVPKFAYRTLQKDVLARYTKSIIGKDDDEEEEIDEKIKLAARRFLSNKGHHSSLSQASIISEVLNLVVVIAAFTLSDELLTGQFYYLGRDWITYIRNSPDNAEKIESKNSSELSPMDQVFPKMSKCEFKKFGPGGSIINYDLLCVMTLNVFHDKVFLFLWFWFWALIVIQTFNLFYRLIILRYRGLQCKLILWRVEHAFLDENEQFRREESVRFRRGVKNFIQTLGYSDWFLLRAISTSTDTLQFTDFLYHLIDRSKKLEKSNENKVSKQENQNDSEGRGLNGRRNAKENCNNDSFVDAQYNDEKTLIHLTRNRNNRGAGTQENLYTHLNQSLREIREEEGQAESFPLIQFHNKHNQVGSNISNHQQQTFHHSTIDIPDGDVIPVVGNSAHHGKP